MEALSPINSASAKGVASSPPLTSEHQPDKHEQVFGKEQSDHHILHLKKGAFLYFGIFADINM